MGIPSPPLLGRYQGQYLETFLMATPCASGVVLVQEWAEATEALSVSVMRGTVSHTMIKA